MSEAMHPYCFAAWDEADPAWRDTRNADARDTYASEPCTCGHCAACDEDDDLSGAYVAPENGTRWTITRAPEPGHYILTNARGYAVERPAAWFTKRIDAGEFVRSRIHATPECETVQATRPVSRGTLEGCA